MTSPERVGAFQGDPVPKRKSGAARIVSSAVAVAQNGKDPAPRNPAGSSREETPIEGDGRRPTYHHHRLLGISPT